MSRCVYDIDVVIIPFDRGIFRGDRNTTLFFLIIRVHDALTWCFTLIQRAGLFKQFINQRGFAVVDMGDDSDVPDFSAHDNSL